MRLSLPLLLLLLAGCDLVSTVGDEAVLAETAEHLVIERTELFSEATYHYAPAGSLDERERYTFLFGACPTDCSEVLEQSGFSPDGQLFAFRTSSSRTDRRTRLLVYSFRGQAVRTLFELEDPVITGYALTDSMLAYTLRGGATRLVTLE